ncbi:hypothetical protein KCV07_g9459, partial [Aureobasidium melanogenum]
MDHYKRVCDEHEITPTAVELRKIKDAVGVPATSNAVLQHFQYGLLYFLPRSSVVYKKGTLLVGWAHQGEGSEKEIWFRPGTTSGMVFSECGAPPRSRYRIDRQSRLCDKWHPSLEVICKPWSGSLTPRPPSIESPASSNQDTRVAERRSAHENQRGTANTDQRRRRVRTVVERDGLTESDSTEPNTENEFTEQDPAEKAKSPVTEERIPIIDLTSDELQDVVKVESSTVATRPIHEEHQATTPSRTKLLNIIQGKTVSEIQETLSQRAAQLPDWIEKIVREELEKKMARDVDVVEDFF